MPFNVNPAIRAAALVATAFMLFKMTALNEHLQLTALGVGMLLGFEAALLLAAFRVFMNDARPPPPNVLHVDTRAGNVLQELAISGVGVMFAVTSLSILMGAGAHEVWAGRVQLNRGPKPLEYVLGICFLAAAVPLVLFRPTFTIDLEKRAIRRFPWGRAVPLQVGPERSTADVRIVSEGFFRTNTGVRLGDIIRGRLGENTFELEMLWGKPSPEEIASRIEYWQGALCAGRQA